MGIHARRWRTWRCRHHSDSRAFNTLALRETPVALDLATGAAVTVARRAP